MVFSISEKFKLSEKFVEQYRGRQPNWGPLGYVTYKRTYARPIDEENRSEEYWETVKRVVEGTYTVQLNHCKNLRLPWQAIKAQKSAQEMYRLMWNFKFLPPGRGLWAMGTDVVWKKGGAALNSCAFVSTKDVNFSFSSPFVWLMDMSMLGVGVAFDTKGAGKITIKEPKMIANTTYTVPDSKEGWCELVGLVLDAYDGRGHIPGTIDYSEIRPEGAPIKTFGGTAPGPEPLINSVEEIKSVLDKRIGQPLSSRCITDLMNIVGKCVVSGGVRRTAELALGNWDDEEYIDLKNRDKYAEEMKKWRWASNNSVYAEPGMDYTDLAERTNSNGEPGYIYLENIRKYGRLKDGVTWVDKAAEGVNPCVTGDTNVLVADGRGSVRIDQLEDGALVYCLDDDGELAIRKARHPRITGHNVPIYKLTLDDGMEIRCTDNHKFRMEDGYYQELKDLQPGDSLDVITRYVPDGRSWSRGDQYLTYSYRGEFKYEHKLVSEFAFGPIPNGHHINHKDGNKLNNTPDNLEYLLEFDHLSEHAIGEENGNFSGITNEELLEIGKSLCESLGRRFSYDEWINYAKDNEYPYSITSEYRKQLAPNFSAFSKRCSAEVNIDLPDLNPRTLRLYKELLEAGYDASIDEDKKEVYVTKKCEVCGEEFIAPYKQREQCVCSRSCSNKIKDYTNNKIGQKKTWDIKKNVVRKEQIKVYLDLKQKNTAVLRREWAEKCKEFGVSSEISRKSSPFTSWKDLKEAASTYNHRVISIEFVGHEDVWNITVDDYHNFFLGGKEGITPGGRVKLCYLNSTQCGEQSLWNQETCTLCEVFPSKHDTVEEFTNTLKYAYLYAKTVTLVPTHSERTNQVLLQNRRIGLSLSGIVDAFEKFGRRGFLNWCDNGYEYVSSLDEKYSRWLCVPRSIKMTTVKPSGTVSLLAGVSPGIHYPHSEYYKRRIRIPENSPLVAKLQNCGVENELSAYNDRTVVFAFPVKSENYKKGKREASIWEQMENAVSIQYYWSDNNISQTVTIKEEEKRDLKTVLEVYEDRLKTVSFLPLDDHNYEQAPYEEITEEEYNNMMSKMKPIDLSDLKIVDENVSEITGCTNDTCEIIDFKKQADGEFPAEDESDE
jgi:ribonucleotide reductase alpha subunit